MRTSVTTNSMEKRELSARSAGLAFAAAIRRVGRNRAVILCRVASRVMPALSTNMPIGPLLIPLAPPAFRRKVRACLLITRRSNRDTEQSRRPL